MPTKILKNTLPFIVALALIAACGGKSDSELAEPTASAPAEAAAPAEVIAAAFPTAALIDPNTASDGELAAIPQLSEVAVAAILAARPFSTASEMDAAIGDAVDDAGRKAIYALMFVKVGLNSGAVDDYKLIPSTMAPEKLAHEFEEYRPYESMEQFSREMSKYVSDAEVAYLGRFVTLD